MRLFKRREKADPLNDALSAGFGAAFLQSLNRRVSDSDETGPDRVDLVLQPEKGYKSWSYVAVQAIVNSAATCAWDTLASMKQTGANDPLRKLLVTGNPVQNSVRLLTSTFLNCELWGSAYWHIQRTASGKPAELWPLPPSLVAGAKIENGIPAAWKVRGSDSKETEIPAEDIVWFRYSFPGGALDSGSPMSAAEAAIQCDLYALRYYSLYFQRGADPRIILETEKENLTDDERESIRSQWASLYSGMRNWFKPLVLKGGLKANTIGGEPNIALLKLREQWREEILAVWRVPPAIAGVYQYANYANVKEQRKIFWEQTIKPKHAAIAADINEQLAPRVGGGEFAWDYSAIDALRPDLTEEGPTALRVMDADEIRQRYFGLPPLEAGKQPVLTTPAGGLLPPVE